MTGYADPLDIDHPLVHIGQGFHRKDLSDQNQEQLTMEGRLTLIIRKDFRQGFRQGSGRFNSFRDWLPHIIVPCCRPLSDFSIYYQKS